MKRPPMRQGSLIDADGCQREPGEPFERKASNVVPDPVDMRGETWGEVYAAVREMLVCSVRGNTNL